MTLRMGRKGEIHEETHNVSGIIRPGCGKRRLGGDNREEMQNRLDNARRVLHQIMAAPDNGIPEEVLEHARCIAVVPHMIKGGFVFGAENGKGVATCRTANGWSAPAFFAITGGSWGLQIGVEGVDLVMIIQGDKGMRRLMSADFSLERTPLRQPDR